MTAQENTPETGAVVDENEQLVDDLFNGVEFETDNDAGKPDVNGEFTVDESTDEETVDGDNTGGVMDKFEADDVDAAATAPDEEKRIFIMVTMQQDKALFDLIDADAKAEGIGRASMARILLAKAYNYKLNESDGRKAHKKYDSEEARIEARKAAAKSRAEEAKLLKEQHKLRQTVRAMKAAGKSPEDYATETARIDAIDDLLMA